MLHNYAWIVERSGPPNENWRLVNSVTDLAWFRKNNPDLDEAPTMHFEFGGGGKHYALTVDHTSLPHLFLALDVWLRLLPGGPVYVYGVRNLFGPVLAHWRRARGQAVHPAMVDILENLILPDAVPTVQMRENVDRRFAYWLLGEDSPSPLSFFEKICPPPIPLPHP